MKAYFSILSPVLILFTGLTFLVVDHFFFWDTIQLASIPAHFYYENNFSKLFLPMQNDTGHVPIFGAYLALIWTIFSKSLFISHIAMLPFIYGVIWQAYTLIKQFISSTEI